MTERMLRTSEKKMRRRIHGPIEDKVRRRPRRNSEIYNLYKYLNVDDIRIRRPGWAIYRTFSNVIRTLFTVSEG